MHASWKDWCRLCANEASTFKLESVDVINGIIFPTMQVSINDIDGDTLSICNDCYKFANRLEHFKERCVETNRLFIYLSNYSHIEMRPSELVKIRSRYLGSVLEDETEQLANDLDADGDQLIDIIPLAELVDNGDDVKTVVASDRQNYHKAKSLGSSALAEDQEGISSDAEQWTPNEIDYEDVRSACYSDPEKMEEVDRMADVEPALNNHTPCDDRTKPSLKCVPVLSKLRRTERGQPPANRKYPVFHCNVCLKTFRSGSYLRKHEATHLRDGEKEPFACNFCDKVFSKAIHVTTHVRLVHERDKPFICEECGKGFGSKGALKEHYIVHTDDRPFPCTRCPKRFKNAARLKTHEDTHNGTLYVCPHCGLQLNTKRTLNMHMVVHSDHKKYRCQYCGNEYKRAKALKAHLILHTGLRPYQCPFCDRSFANGSNCRSHKKKFHPLELAALEAAGGQMAATNIPKLENLQPKSQGNARETEPSEKINRPAITVLARVDNAPEKENPKIKPGKTRVKKTSHRTPVANRIKVSG